MTGDAELDTARMFLAEWATLAYHRHRPKPHDSMGWHNFHTHAQRWQYAGQAQDTRSLGPAESFVVETVAPEVLHLHAKLREQQEPGKRPHGARAYHLRGDFLVHCHVEMHMMQGLSGLVRSLQTVWLTPEQAQQIADKTGLALDPGPGVNDCPTVELLRCERLGCGEWIEIPNPPEVCAMHATSADAATQRLPLTQRRTPGAARPGSVRERRGALSAARHSRQRAHSPATPASANQ